MILAHKIQLDPTVKQKIYFNQACGTARFVWNWALEEWNKQYKSGKKPNANSLKKKFNVLKYKEYPWIKDIHRDAHSQPFANLQKAFNGFFKKKSKYPKFKKKGKRDSFYVANDKFRINDKEIRLPKIGWVRLTEALRFEGKVTSAVVSRKADKWYVSVMVDVGDYVKPRNKNGIIGIDLGLINFATLSTGEKIKAPKPLKRNLKRLQKLSKNHSRKQKGSKNRNKSAMKLARLHAKISNIRIDFIHKLTTRLCNENQVIVIEGLAVSNMIKNHRLSRAINDVGWYEFRRQLAYKSLIYETNLIVANRFMPSSKICSNCGIVKKTLFLSERVYKCDKCGVEIDRDINAAKNLHTLGLREIQACGENVRPAILEAVFGETGTKSCSLVSTN